MSAHLKPTAKPKPGLRVEKPEPRADALFTIPATEPFLTSLAAAILSGDLPRPGRAKPSPLDLPKYTILLPTRRAARALQAAFLSLTTGQALLLPRIAALGAPDEDAWLLAEAGDAESEGGNALELPPAIGATERALALTRLVLKWQESIVPPFGETPDLLRGRAPVPTPVQAHALATELARLLDFVEAEAAELKDLAGLAPTEFSAHWQLTLNFLTILTQHWPAHLEEHGLMSPVARRNLLTEAWAMRLLSSAPNAPIIAAGSTGSLPATSNLLGAIASLPHGAVVLPGLDQALDATSWSALDRHPEHPQYGMARLLAGFGIDREQVQVLTSAQPGEEAQARLAAISQAMRPASTTEHWSSYAAGGDAEALRSAFFGVSLIAASSPQDEAETVALILRHALETENRTAALVTPDRALARRVAARLSRWGLAIDDSAGRSIARTPPGAFLELVVEAAANDFAAVPLASLLKHPFARLGLPRNAALDAARKLELIALRRPILSGGIAALRAALDAARDEDQRRALHRNGKVLADRGGIDDAASLLDRLQAAMAPLTSLFAQGGPVPLKTFVAAHVAAAEALASDEHGSADELWRGEAGEALSLHLAELLSKSGAGLECRATDYPALYRALVSDIAVRPRAPAHPRLAIWGPLEARLQQPDILVMGGLNEGVWPRAEDAGPWLNRQMRETLGLPAPERRIGLSAHDFAQGLASRRVYLTRAEKAEGAPTVTSRWLLRVKALLDGVGASDALEPDLPFLAWARARDDAPPPVLQKAPAPCPPVEARPVQMSVTAVQRWTANPYQIFAQMILRLDPMPDLGELPDARARGDIIHAVLGRFAEAWSDSLPDDIEGALMDEARDLFSGLGAQPAVLAFWLPQFERFARWFAETEPARRKGVVRTLAEVDGAIDLATPRGFRLTARADRIDLKEDGSVAIYDYKSGSAPKPRAVDELFAPQLPLEAAIAACGGFAGLAEARPDSIWYVRATGRGQGGSEEQAGKCDAGQLAEEALAALTKLAIDYENPDTPYRALRRPGQHFRAAYRYDEYEHLARRFDDDEEDAP